MKQNTNWNTYKIKIHQNRKIKEIKLNMECQIKNKLKMTLK